MALRVARKEECPTPASVRSQELLVTSSILSFDVGGIVTQPERRSCSGPLQSLLKVISEEGRRSSCLRTIQPLSLSCAYQRRKAP
jgi:hypothetical protein